MLHVYLTRADLQRQPSETIQFVEVFDGVGTKIHVGCIMARGLTWVEVSLPLGFKLPNRLMVRVPPNPLLQAVAAVSRKIDSVRLDYHEAIPDGMKPTKR